MSRSDDPAGGDLAQDPTEQDLADPLFEAIWQAIKGWDLSRTSNGLYAGATGTDVMIILRAVRPFLLSRADRERALSLMAEAVRHDALGFPERGNHDEADARRLLHLSDDSHG